MVQGTLCWSIGTYPAPTPFARALHEWIAVVCEQRVFFYDYMTHRVCARWWCGGMSTAVDPPP